MNPVTQTLGLKSLETLLLQKGYVICQQTGQKITRVDELVTAYLSVGEEQFIIFPVHKENSKALLQTFLKTFSHGIPPLEDKEPLNFSWRE